MKNLLNLLGLIILSKTWSISRSGAAKFNSFGKEVEHVVFRKLAHVCGPNSNLSVTDSALRISERNILRALNAVSFFSDEISWQRERLSRYASRVSFVAFVRRSLLRQYVEFLLTSGQGYTRSSSRRTTRETFALGNAAESRNLTTASSIPFSIQKRVSQTPPPFCCLPSHRNGHGPSNEKSCWPQFYDTRVVVSREGAVAVYRSRSQ